RGYPGIRPRFESDPSLAVAALSGARDPWRDLQGAAGRQRGVSPPRPVDHAFRDHGCAAGPGLSSRRRHGTERAVLGQPRRIRRHQSSGGKARGGCVARARAWQACDGAAAPSRRHRGRQRSARSRVPHDLFGQERRVSIGGPHAGVGVAVDAGRSRDGGPAQSRAWAAHARIRLLGAAARRARRDAPRGGSSSCQAGAEARRQACAKTCRQESKPEKAEGEKTMKLRIALPLLALAVIVSPAAAQDTLKIAIGQINNWENQAPTLGEDAGIFKKHNLKIESFGTQGAGETIQAVISGSADLGAGVGLAGAMRAFSKGAPVRVLLPAFTGTGDLYWYVRADSPIKTLKDATAQNTIAYSTSGSSSNNIVVAFQQELGLKAKATATGGPPGTFTQVMTGQIDIGWAAPPFALKEIREGKIRIIARGSDVPSLHGQTVRVIIVNANALKEKKDAIMRFAAGYREAADWMYDD